MSTVSQCPICDHHNLVPHLSCVDYTVSHETFHIKRCNNCSFLITSPVPEPDQLPRYYDSPNYSSHTTRTTSAQDLIYRLLRSFTLRWKLKLVNQFHPITSRKQLLDVGCGTGTFLKVCQSNGWHVSGVETAPKAREHAHQLTDAKITETIPTESTPRFDIITLWHVLEHLPDLHQTLSNLKNILHTHGKIFIAVPNHHSWDASHYQQYWAAYDVPRHLWHFSQPNMAQLLKKHSLRIHQTIPMKLDAYYVSLLSEKYKHNNPIKTTLGAILKGFQSNNQAKRTGEYSSLIYIVSQ